MKNVVCTIFCILKKYKVFFSILIILVAIILGASPFVSVNFPNPNLAESCFSIVFDKWEMNAVDKIVIKTPQKETTINDKNLIKHIVKETMVAESGGYQAMYGEYYLYLYHNQKIVRIIQLSTTYKEYAIAYQSDAFHWIAGYESGTVILSDDVISQIENILNENGDLWKTE